MKIVGVYNPPLYVTLGGLFFALSACIFSFNHRFELAVICFILSGICDLFDGVIARKTRRTEEEKAFGLYIDSTVDMASFGLTPVIILLHSGFNGAVDYFFFFFYCSCASIRLAWFNLLQHKNEETPDYYTGLPVTFSALVLPLVFTVGLLLEGGAFKLLVRLSIVVLGFLFILKIPIKKPGGIFYIIFPLVAAVLIFFWLLRALH
ncbi:MAG TPA: hypothetical protein ENI88_02580 [Desulfobulbus sp.]|nr:hypothetical protein [Desulfobulbus sp.]